ncbi:cytochrome C oxidase copper chaperone-domain-containing protein [Achaetomium macrosporum]|uniref:Cytochrome C oxidase copper chaperone-domain-containing protein n=1 Tax=Achaetomium macrosporum TaxID=79813 RepID=A0AAN7H941_9PEZI|nr:cytochrome C oxidase copper chaperone-domain-containing protein [Achaetomium macrosporum]
MATPAVAPIGSGAAAAPVPQAAETVSKPKPCCVCKDEKAKRDECMLFSTAADPQKECTSTIEQYRSCMARYGFKV